MNYIVLDLEWNQSGTGEEPEAKEIPFEIIDIGAIQLNNDRCMTGEFNQLIKPTVYGHMHHVTSKIIHLHMQDLQKGRPFKEVMEEFLLWCSRDFIFCTWGPLDLWELQRNMKFYGMKPLSNGPIRFLDVQKLFSIAYEDSKTRRSLEYAIDYLKVDKDIPFHRAFSDAYYTAKVLNQLDEKVLPFYSFDTYNLPQSKEEEIFVLFDDYQKYISREFFDRAEAMENREVLSTRCFKCRKNIRKKIRWFTPNGKHYYCISYCPVHGYMKSKIRIKKSENDGIYVVKTSKFVSEEECRKIQRKKDQGKNKIKYDIKNNKFTKD